MTPPWSSPLRGGDEAPSPVGEGWGEVSFYFRGIATPRLDGERNDDLESLYPSLFFKRGDQPTPPLPPLRGEGGKRGGEEIPSGWTLFTLTNPFTLTNRNESTKLGINRNQQGEPCLRSNWENPGWGDLGLRFSSSWLKYSQLYSLFQCRMIERGNAWLDCQLSLLCLD